MLQSCKHWCVRLLAGILSIKAWWCVGFVYSFFLFCDVYITLNLLYLTYFIIFIFIIMSSVQDNKWDGMLVSINSTFNNGLCTFISPVLIDPSFIPGTQIIYYSYIYLSLLFFSSPFFLHFSSDLPIDINNHELYYEVRILANPMCPQTKPKKSRRKKLQVYLSSVFIRLLHFAQFKS